MCRLQRHCWRLPMIKRYLLTPMAKWLTMIETPLSAFAGTIQDGTQALLLAD